jgi:hypothetical protein
MLCNHLHHHRHHNQIHHHLRRKLKHIQRLKEILVLAQQTHRQTNS